MRFAVGQDVVQRAHVGHDRAAVDRIVPLPRRRTRGRRGARWRRGGTARSTPRTARARCAPLASSGVRPAAKWSLGLAVNVLEVLAHPTHAVDAAHRTVAGDDPLRRQRLDARERLDPLIRRPFPADRRAAMEEHVAGEHDAVGGTCTTRSPSVCAGPDVEDVDAHAVEVERDVAVDHLVGRPQLDAGEVERRELVLQIDEVLGRIDHRAHRLGLRRREVVEALGAPAVGDDRRLGEELVAPAVIAVADAAWAAAIDDVLSAHDGWHLALQPIVDLRRGTVVGHEVLSRFTTGPAAGPDVWFRQAERLGRGPALTAATIGRALSLLDELPANTFLTVNLEPGHATAPEVQDAFGARDLQRLFVEVTEHGVIDDLSGVRAVLSSLRDRGARIAIDDAGAGYAGLGVLLALRPQLVKLDGALVGGLDRDPVKRVLIRALGELASSIDAWVLAEGIETDSELSRLVELEVPLGQGYLLGRPATGFANEVSFEVASTIHESVVRTDARTTLEGLVEPAPEATLEERPVPDAARTGPEVVVDAVRRPVALDPGDGTRDRTPLVLRTSEALVTTARRVASRGGDDWHHPLVITDGRGAYLGIVPVARLLEALAWQDTT